MNWDVPCTLPISPNNKITAAIAIIIAAEITGFGAAAVPDMIGSIGDPPKNALTKPDTPAMIFEASKTLTPDPVVVETWARSESIDGYAILVPILNASNESAALTIKILSVQSYSLYYCSLLSIGI